MARSSGTTAAPFLVTESVSRSDTFWRRAGVSNRYRNPDRLKIKMLWQRVFDV